MLDAAFVSDVEKLGYLWRSLATLLGSPASKFRTTSSALTASLRAGSGTWRREVDVGYFFEGIEKRAKRKAKPRKRPTAAKAKRTKPRKRLN